MGKTILFLLLFGFWSFGAIAQSKSDDINIQQLSPNTGSTDSPISDKVLVDQFSNLTGISTLHQLAADAAKVARIKMSGDNNEARIIQSGTGHIGAINLDGTDNVSTLHQTGSELFSLIHIKGYSNRLDVNQEGTNLGNLVQVLGRGLNIDITQDPSGFQYSQAGAGTPVTVTSSAQNVPIVIRNN
jgi:hypothetical protein